MSALRKQLIHFYAEHNPTKMGSVDELLQYAAQHNMDGSQLMNEMRKRYPKSLRERLSEFYDQHCPEKKSSINAIIERAQQDQMSDVDLLHQLHQKYGIAAASPPTQNPPLPPPQQGAPTPLFLRSTALTGQESATSSKVSGLRAAQNRDLVDRVLKEELRQWMNRILHEIPDAALERFRNASTEESFEELRNGAVLLLLLNVLRYGAQHPSSKYRPPKADNLFYARELVTQFLRRCREEFNMPNIELFMENDLVEGKNDRIVLSALFNLARRSATCYRTPLPTVVKYEMEIEKEEEEASLFVDESRIHRALRNAIVSECTVRTSELWCAEQSERSWLLDSWNVVLTEDRIRTILMRSEHEMRLFLSREYDLDITQCLNQINEYDLYQQRQLLRDEVSRREEVVHMESLFFFYLKRALDDSHQCIQEAAGMDLNESMLLLVAHEDNSTDDLFHSDVVQDVSWTYTPKHSDAPPLHFSPSRSRSGSPSLSHSESFVTIMAREGSRYSAYHHDQALHDTTHDAPRPLTYRKRKVMERRARDAVDAAAARVVREVQGSWSLAPIHRPGQFLLWSPETGDKMLLFLRILQGVVMIRVGGGWENFREFLRRRARSAGL